MLSITKLADINYKWWLTKQNICLIFSHLMCYCGICITLYILARSAKLPTGLYILPSVISSFFSSFLMIMIDLDIFFRYLKGRCHGNRFCEKMANSPLSSLWHSQTEWDIVTSVCAYSVNACTLCENFVKFGPVTPEWTELICERLVWYGQKTAVFGQISPDLLDRFS